MASLEGAVGLVLAVAAGAFLLRLVSKPSRDEQIGLRASTPDHEGTETDELDLGEPSTGEAVAITSDGCSFIPFEDGVKVLRPKTQETGTAVTTESRGFVPWEQVESLRPGELIGARVRHASYGEGGWLLEALGRDHDYCVWSFETREAAQAGLHLLEHRIVRAPVDEDGVLSPPGDDAYAVALEESRQTEHELAMLSDEEKASGEDDAR